MDTDSTLFRRILRINLSTGKVWIDEPPLAFFKQYIGGAIGAYYLLNLTKPGFDPLSEENVLTFIPGLLAHLPVGVFSRVSITAKSPLTGAIIDAQAGGFWARECKASGFDAIVIEGRAPEPVYIVIHEGKVDIHSAKSCWGMDTGDAEEVIRTETGLPRLKSCTIGPGGENQVRYACIANNLRHFAGRGGLGAVMGSKNLKAVSIQSTNRTSPKSVDREGVNRLIKAINLNYDEDEFIRVILHPFGTHWAVWFNQEHGRLPTYNFREGVFPNSSNYDHNALANHPMNRPAEGCFACTVRCKRSLAYEEGNTRIDPVYGGAEYESLGNLGSLLGLHDLVTIEKANELCARYTLDTISTGATIGWAMECYEKGIITKAHTNGLELQWGNGDTVLQLIDMIAHREGFGNLLAEGSRRAATHFGSDAEALAMQCKGMEFPAIEPRVDPPQALAYAVCLTGADHMTTGGSDCGPEFWELETPPREQGITENLAKVYYLQRMLGSVIDGIGTCRFLIGTSGFQNILDLFKTTLDWQTSIWELMRAGERRLTLYKVFNGREGFTIDDDILPPRAFQPLKNGPEDGAIVDREQLRLAVEAYYAICGWNPKTGSPIEGKLMEMDLKWVNGIEKALPFEVKPV
jgi:aldehyde:ferredoxin oxidoreductase